jgi:hypothetical protein
MFVHSSEVLEGESASGNWMVWAPDKEKTPLLTTRRMAPGAADMGHPMCVSYLY